MPAPNDNVKNTCPAAAAHIFKVNNLDQWGRKKNFKPVPAPVKKK
ncbi:hypothetical protein A0O36_01815 [Piscirickettsiaceae bacterium NZ-RLO1]|nr:hypothetical protein A0O36_01815 [Piscirickettsiaceae bacterium NZ-RLO1]